MFVSLVTNHPFQDGGFFIAFIPILYVLQQPHNEYIFLDKLMFHVRETLSPIFLTLPQLKQWASFL